VPVYGLNRNQWVQIISSWSGWLMDGYVTIAYALVVVTMQPIFFPGNVGLIGGFLGLAFGAIARSVGSLFLGNFLGDRIGRKRMLTLTILLFSIFSALIGVLPTYSSVGIAAPILLYVLLFAVGLFAGAEYGGGAALSSESVPAEKRGFVGAFVQSGFGTGYFIAGFMLSALGLIFSGPEFSAIGWRVLFFTTLVPGALTLLIRAVTPESEVFKQMVGEKRVERIPVAGMLKEAGGPMVLAILITTGLLYINTGTFAFYPSVLQAHLMDNNVVSVGFVLALINLISLFGVWFGGAISNLVGGRKVSMVIYTVLFVISAYPLILLGYSANIYSEIIGFGLQAFIEAMIFSTLPAFLSETFSKKYRTTAVGFTYNAGGIVGGFAAVFITLSAGFMEFRTAWVLNLGIAGLVMILAIAASRETWSARAKGEKKDLIHE